LQSIAFMSFPPGMSASAQPCLRTNWTKSVKMPSKAKIHKGTGWIFVVDYQINVMLKSCRRLGARCRSHTLVQPLGRSTITSTENCRPAKKGSHPFLFPYSGAAIRPEHNHTRGQPQPPKSQFLSLLYRFQKKSLPKVFRPSKGGWP